MKQRTRVVTVMSTTGALVVGALVGAVYVTLSLGGSTTPTPVEIQQVAAPVTPTSSGTTAAARKAAVAKPVKKVAAKTTAAPTSSKARSFVSKIQNDTPTEEPTPDVPPQNGAGDNGRTGQPNDPTPGVTPSH